MAFILSHMDSDTVAVIKMLGILVVVFGTPFIYTIFAWIMFIIESIGFAFTTDFNTVRLDMCYSYNYLIKHNAIPAGRIRDRAYIAQRVMNLGMFGMLTGCGVFGLFTPESVRVTL